MVVFRWFLSTPMTKRKTSRWDVETGEPGNVFPSPASVIFRFGPRYDGLSRKAGALAPKRIFGSYMILRLLQCLWNCWACDSSESSWHGVHGNPLTVGWNTQNDQESNRTNTPPFIKRCAVQVVNFQHFLPCAKNNTFSNTCRGVTCVSFQTLCRVAHKIWRKERW